MATYYHGSTSASLVGLFHPDARGLRPAGKLLASDIVPYSGELWLGTFSKQGVNIDHLSVVPISNLDEALDYAQQFARAGWNPSSSQKEVKNIQREINRLQHDSKKSLLTEYYSERLDSYRDLIDVEKRRQSNWERLGKTERKLISLPWPIIYKVNTVRETIPVRSQCSNEKGLLHGAELEELVLYVPKEKLKITNSLCSVERVPVYSLDIIDVSNINTKVERVFESFLQRWN